MSGAVTLPSCLVSIVDIRVTEQMLKILPAIKHAVDRDDPGQDIDRESYCYALGVTLGAEIWTNIVALCASLGKR